MNARTLMTLVPVMLMTACAGSPPAATQGTAEDEAAIRGLPEKYVAAFNANDAAGMAALADDSYQSVSPDGSLVTGKAGLQQMEEQGIKARRSANITATLSVTTDYLQWIGADAAAIGGAWSATGLPAGGPEKGSWMGVARKGADGQWRLTSTLAADYLPPPPPAAPAKE
jgi:uncharacterized protein (TIGR02246 family)